MQKKSDQRLLAARVEALTLSQARLITEMNDLQEQWAHRLQVIPTLQRIYQRLADLEDRARWTRRKKRATKVKVRKKRPEVLK